MRTARSMLRRVSAYVEVTRPVSMVFVLMPVAAGALRAGAFWSVQTLLVTVAFALLSAGSQAFNAGYDAAIDTVTAKRRPVPTGRMSAGAAKKWGAVLKVAGLVVAGFAGWLVFLLAAAGAVLSVLYSMPPVRLRKNGWLGAGSAALGYAVLPMLAGAGVMSGDVLLGASLFGLALFFGGHLKDYKDLAESDFGVRSLPAVLGPQGAAWVIAVGIVPMAGLLVADFGLMVWPLLALAVSGYWLFKDPLRYGPVLYYVDGIVFAVAEVLFGVG